MKFSKKIQFMAICLGFAGGVCNATDGGWRELNPQEVAVTLSNLPPESIQIDDGFYNDGFTWLKITRTSDGTNIPGGVWISTSIGNANNNKVKSAVENYETPDHKIAVYLYSINANKAKITFSVDSQHDFTFEQSLDHIDTELLATKAILSVYDVFRCILVKNNIDGITINNLSNGNEETARNVTLEILGSNIDSLVHTQYPHLN